MSDEILTGSTLMRAIADAMDNDEGPDVLTISMAGHPDKKGWSWDQIVAADLFGHQIRRKPKMRHLIDANGKRWEWPEPLKFAPKIGSTYYFVTLSKGSGVELASWRPTSGNHAHLANRIAHKNCDDCRKHARALIAASGGEVSDE